MRRLPLTFAAIRLLGTPCWCLLSMLAFILYKKMHLDALQITSIIALKPLSSLFSPYVSQLIHRKKQNLVIALILRHIPFLFIPWISSPWLIIAAFGSYMMLTRATLPAWMELFKHNLPKEKCEEMVSFGTAIDYIGNAVLAVGMGLLLDGYQDIWKWLFAGSALLGVLSSFLLLLSPLVEPVAPPKSKLTNPWREVFGLLRSRRDFLLFQIGFMLGGSGLMIMQPALPAFFIDILHLSFTEMGIAIALCKAVGVALSSSLWTKLFRKWPIFGLSALVTFFASLFPLLLFISPLHSALLYGAYLIYGIMQAGSELSWHMSALVFAKEKDSSLFSVTNVFTVGLRGCVIPFLGTLLLPLFHPIGVILTGALFCLAASTYFLLPLRKTSARPQGNQT